MSVTVELGELDADLWDAFKCGGEWVAASEYRKLMAQNAKLREEVNYLKKGDVLHVLTDQELAEQQKHEREMQASITALDDENTKLRELVVSWSVINKHMSLCATTDCGQCPVREECEESVYLEGLLGIDPKGLSWRVQKRMAETTDVQAKNAKLREELEAAKRDLSLFSGELVASKFENAKLRKLVQYIYDEGYGDDWFAEQAEALGFEPNF